MLDGFRIWILAEYIFNYSKSINGLSRIKTWAKMNNFISLRSVVKGSIVDLLKSEGMECLSTQDGLVDIINALARYKEEGQSLWPEIYIFDEKEKVFNLLPKCEYLYIDKGKKLSNTLLMALKKCAPLAKGGWVIYILRKNDEFEYGVFRSNDAFISIPIAETLVNKGDAKIPILSIHSVAENLIEIKGVNKNSLLVEFGTSEPNGVNPEVTISGFIKLITRDSIERAKEQLSIFYEIVMLNLLKSGHGSLIVVLSQRKRKLPRILRFGIQLNRKIDIQEKIIGYLNEKNMSANNNLLAFSALIGGMLSSDGITVLSTNGSVIGYNIFLPHKKSTGGDPILGGARTRTFNILQNMIGKEIEGALFKSQDGKILFRGLDEE